MKGLRLDCSDNLVMADLVDTIRYLNSRIQILDGPIRR